MKNFTIICMPILLLMFFVLGCSSNSNNTSGVLSPGISTLRDAQPAEDGHTMMGIYSLQIDIESNSVNIARDRNAEKHWNVTPMLIPPACPDCFVAAITGYDPVSKEVDVKLTLKNPTNLTGYDVRGIILDFGFLTLLNPDSYTKLFGPGDINPFIAWITGPDRSFASYQIHNEDITILNPNWPAFPAFSFVIDASWPGHCHDPYEVKPFNIGEDLQSDGSNSVLVNTVVHDWQDDIESVTIDLTPLGGPFGAPMTDVGGGYYQKEISYVSGPGEGYYPLLITATTSADVAFKSTYNYVTVHVVGGSSEFPVDFDDEERISFTDGQSFIWPKHALAVDSDGYPHVVWADNSPDPQSHLFKIYYSWRNASSVWSTPETIGSGDVDVIYATMCIDDSDVVHVVWEDQRPGELATDIYYANSDDGWDTEVLLTSATPQVRHAFPRCAYGDGLIHIVWHDNLNDLSGEDFDVRYMTYDPDTGTTDNEMDVAAETGVFEGYPSIGIDAEGDVHVAYQKYDGKMKIFHKEKPYGTFGSAHSVAANYAYQPSLYCGNSADEIYVTYYDYHDGTFCDIYVSISTNGGSSFDDTKVSTSNTEFQIHPDIAQGWNGDLYVIWAEEGYIDIDGEPGPDDLNNDGVINQDDAVPHRTYFRQRSGTSWDNEVTLVGGENSSAFPQIAVDTDDFVHVSYMKWTIDTPYDNYELYYRRSLPWG